MTFRDRFAITFGECAILHTGGTEYGACRENGYSKKELIDIALHIHFCTGVDTEIIDLTSVLPEKVAAKTEEACVLVIRNGASIFVPSPRKAANHLYYEQESKVKYDRKYYDSRRKQTLHKRARWNIVFGAEEQVASEDFTQCTVRAFSSLLFLNAFRNNLQLYLGERARGLYAEGNHYYEDKSGIGFHGDSERKTVICLSLGKSTTLRFQWRLPGSSEHTLSPIDIEVNHGDVYIMSEKATGFDWKHRSKVRVVHSAGSEKYIGRP